MAKHVDHYLKDEPVLYVRHFKGKEYPVKGVVTLCGGIPFSRARVTKVQSAVTCKACMKALKQSKPDSSREDK